MTGKKKFEKPCEGEDMAKPASRRPWDYDFLVHGNTVL